MQLDERSSLLLQRILTTPEIRSKNLEEQLQLSRRQIGYSFDKVNSWLKSNDYPIIKKNKQGYFIVPPHLLALLNIEVQDNISAMYIFSEKERAQFIMLLLLTRTEELSLHHFTGVLEVSKNTILNDLKLVAKELENFNLNVHYSRPKGYCILGEEYCKRNLLMEIIYNVLKMHNGRMWILRLTKIEDEELTKYYERIIWVEKKLKLTFTDENLEFIPIMLSLVFRRTRQGKIIHSFNIHYDELSDTREYKVVEEFLLDLETLPTEEKLFITLHLLSAKLSSSVFLTEEILKELTKAIDDMLTVFERKSCIILQDRHLLLKKILLHLKPAYYRIKYKLNTYNPLKDKILSEYAELHHLVKKSISPITLLMNSEIPDDEVVYITILIGGWLRRQKDSIQYKTKALVVCPSGVSVSKLIESSLKYIFPEFIFLETYSVREFQQSKLDYDIVFSPVYVQTIKKLFIVKSVISQEEASLLRRQVLQSLYNYVPFEFDLNEILNIIEQQAKIENKPELIKKLENYFYKGQQLQMRHSQREDPNLNELITPETICLLDSVSSWEDGIRASAQPLLRNNSIDSRYIEAMISHYDETEPYIIIAPNLAIPHAMPEDGVNRIAMSLLLLEKGVKFSNECSVNIIIVIAAIDRQKHLRALLQLIKLTECSKWLESIKRAKTKDEVYNLINQFAID